MLEVEACSRAGNSIMKAADEATSAPEVESNLSKIKMTFSREIKRHTIFRDLTGSNAKYDVTNFRAI